MTTRPSRPLPPLPTPSSTPSPGNRRHLPPKPPPKPPSPTTPAWIIDTPRSLTFHEYPTPGPSRSNSASPPRSPTSIPAIHFTLDATSVISLPGVLSSLLHFTPWDVFYPLICSCRSLHLILDDPILKNIVLSEFVPGYRLGLRDRDLLRYQDVPVTIRDLNLLRLSLQYPVHKYPLQALNLLSPSPLQANPDVPFNLITKLMAFTQAHSRFVLLIQALVHSSSAPLPREPPEPRRIARSPQGTARELVFPPPLSYTKVTVVKDDSAVIDATAWTINRHSPVRVSLTPKASMLRRSKSKRPGTLLSRTLTTSRSQPIFRKGEKPPLPPPSLRAMELYSGTWTRSLYAKKSPPTDDDRSSFYFRPPHRKFATAPAGSSDSLAPNPHYPNSFCESPPFNYSNNASPHDLRMALSRTRAPVLRVFVPCSEHSWRQVQECEDQLIDSGLWNHLSTGDIVCNFGFIPASPVNSPNDDDETCTEFGTFGQHKSAARQWLLFDGERLVIHTPPDPPPLVDPLSLPSPCYYHHILSGPANPKIVLRFPANRQIPQLTLARTTSELPSPQSAGGYALVQRYVWVAKILRTPIDGMGEGWEGEWVLEAEGSKEGRQKILNSFSGNQGVLWTCEIVKDRTGGKKVWLKLLDCVKL